MDEGRGRGGLGVCIVGGGVAGLACARVIGDRCPVVVLDKGRGPGGRAATRRGDLGKFDHGAQFFTARGASFRGQVQRMTEAGAVARWDGRVGVIRNGVWAATDEQRWVGVPGMNGLVRAMGEGIAVRYGVRASAVRRAEGSAGWVVIDEQGQALGPFGFVVLAVPSVQAAELLRPVAPDLAERAGRAVMRPCWAVMAAFEGAVPVGFDAASVEGDGPLAWVAREGSKPGRDRDGVDRWVLHATPDWSEAMLEQDAETIGPILLEAFGSMLEGMGVGGLPALRGLTAHRWRYALASEPLGEACLFDAERSIGVCGDWLIGARIEAAFDSGTALGRRVLDELG